MGVRLLLRLKRTSVNTRIGVGSLVKSLVVPNGNLFPDLAANLLLILSLKGRAQIRRMRFEVLLDPLTMMMSRWPSIGYVGKGE